MFEERTLLKAHKTLKKKAKKEVGTLKAVFFKEMDKRKCNKLIAQDMPKIAAYLEKKLGVPPHKIDNASFHTILTGEVSKTCANVGCSNKTGYDVGKRFFKTCCSKVCSNASGIIKEKRERTMLKRYGVVNPYQSEKVKRKIAKTNLRKYGVANPSGSDEVKAKRRATSLSRYGTEHHMHSEVGKKALVDAMLRKYGVSNCMHLDEIKAKIRETCLERYGATNAMKNKEVAKRCTEIAVQRCIEKYGVTNAMLHPGVLEKWQQSYGKRKTVNLCGKDIYVQGYEGFVFQKLFDISPFENITTNVRRTRSVPYTYKGKSCRYVPDAKIKMLDGSIRIVEVKSWFTLKNPKNVAKFKAATRFYNALGADFILVIAEPGNDYIKVVINPDSDLKALIKTAGLFSRGRRTW